MSTKNTKAPEKAAVAVKEQPLLPPDEQFWERYSPHHELPLSGVSSFALHALAIGFLVLLALGVIRLHSNSRATVEAVRLESAGGGGSRHGVGDGRGVGDAPTEDVPGPENPNSAPVSEQPKKDLTLAAPQEKAVDFDPEKARPVRSGEGSAASARLSDLLQKKLGMVAGHGRGGSGSGGGKGSGKGTGTGDGVGAGDGTGRSLTKREKRMVRWSMTFETGYNGREYINQLHALGAIVAIPTDDSNPPKGYYVIKNEDLKKRPPPLVEEDVSQLNRIYWVDNRPDSVNSLLKAMDLMKLRVSHIVAFMPPELEEKLVQLERQHRNYNEDEIDETEFKLRRRGNGYEPYVVRQSKK